MNKLQLEGEDFLEIVGQQGLCELRRIWGASMTSFHETGTLQDLCDFSITPINIQKNRSVAVTISVLSRKLKRAHLKAKPPQVCTQWLNCGNSNSILVQQAWKRACSYPLEL